MKLVLMAGDIRLKEEQVGVAGDVYIFDASVATPGHFSKVSPAMVKKFLICVQVNHIHKWIYAILSSNLQFLIY